MKVRAAGAIVIGLTMGLALAACGGDDERSLSRAEFRSRANAICSRHIKTIEDATKARFAAKEIPLAGEIEALAENTVIPELDRMRSELDDLRPPENDEEDFDDYLKELDRAIDDEVKQDPAVMLSEEASQNAFATSDDLAEDAGVTECGRIGQRLQQSVGAPRLTG